ncbi:hypothetical protein BH24ACT21_BH24ACT21_12480 [soil metagenome]
MAGTVGSPYRKILVAVLAILGCVALLLFCSRLVSAQQMEASWYGPGFEGNLTANEEVFDPSGYTAAHKTYDFDTKLIVTYEGRSVVVRINDRGPYVAGRELDLSQGAAEYIGLTSVGVGVVDVEVADPSTEVGPYAPNSNNTSNRSAQQAAAADSSDKPNQNKPARQQNGRNANGNSAQAVEDQYASEDQYAAEDQYVEPQEIQEAAPEPAPPAPKPAVPVLPPEPEPEALLSPPTELAVPNSTVQKRVELEVAAQPTPQPVEEEVVEPAPEPEPVEETAPEPTVEKPSEELTVLPDTGGAPLSIPAAGALLVALGISVRILRR